MKEYKKISLSIPFLFCFLLTGCGQYGPLYLPPAKQKEIPTEKAGVESIHRSFNTQLAPQ